MKVIIAGGREFDNYEFLQKECDKILYDTKELEIVEGGATGADRLGRRYANINGIPYRTFEADWKTHGKAAGPIRNRQMAQYSDILIAFWDGKSRGTNNMIGHANELGLKVHIIKY